MDTKELVERVRRALTNEEWGERHEVTHDEILALCDAVEALQERVESLEYSFGVTPNASDRAPAGPISSLTAPPLTGV